MALTDTDLQRSHGPKAVETRANSVSRERVVRAFNEAPARRPWRLLAFVVHFPDILCLQRSHGPKAVETQWG